MNKVYELLKEYRYVNTGIYGYNKITFEDIYYLLNKGSNKQNKSTKNNNNSNNISRVRKYVKHN